MADDEASTLRSRGATSTHPRASSDIDPSSPSVSGSSQGQGESGFLGQVVQSIWEPGANYAVVMAMNVSFFLLILVLFALAFLTSWNKHVLLLLVVTTVLWGAMLWFIVEISKIQSRPDNLPPGDPSLLDGEGQSEKLQVGAKGGSTLGDLKKDE